MTVSSSLHLMGKDLRVTTRVATSILNSDIDLLYVTFRDGNDAMIHVTLSGPPTEILLLLHNAYAQAQLSHEQFVGERLDREDADYKRAEEDATDQALTHPIGRD